MFMSERRRLNAAEGGGQTLKSKSRAGSPNGSVEGLANLASADKSPEVWQDYLLCNLYPFQ